MVGACTVPVKSLLLGLLEERRTAIVMRTRHDTSVVCDVLETSLYSIVVGATQATRAATASKASTRMAWYVVRWGVVSAEGRDATRLELRPALALSPAAGEG